MIVTETQAAEMWCPAANGGQSWQDQPVNCIGSRCMWFRWAEPQMAKHNGLLGVDLRMFRRAASGQPANQAVPVGELEKAGYREGEDENSYTLVPGRRGFCGMAGSPE